MLRKFGIIAVLSLLAVAFAAVPALATGTPVFNAAAAPTGTHVQTGSPSCSFGSDGLTVVCSSYELAGVGNTNASASLVATYSATVTCTNNGGKTVPVKSTLQTAPTTTGSLSPKNGRLAVPTLTSGPVPTAAQFEAAATCPNPNWTKATDTSTIALVSSTYTLTFEGFTSPYITIVDP
jgi:hypothetical protein